MNTPKITIPKERIKLYEFKAEIDSHKGRAEVLAQNLNPVLEEWNKLNIGDLTIEELNSIINNPKVRALEDLVRAKIAGNIPLEIQGVKLSLEKVRQIVEIPDLTELSKKYSYFYGLAKQAREARQPVPLSAVTIENGKACMCLKSFEAVKEAHTYYAEDDDEKEATLILEQIAELGQYLLKQHRLRIMHGQFINQSNGALPDVEETTVINGNAIKSHFNRRKYNR